MLSPLCGSSPLGLKEKVCLPLFRFTEEELRVKQAEGSYWGVNVRRVKSGVTWLHSSAKAREGKAGRGHLRPTLQVKVFVPSFRWLPNSLSNNTPELILAVSIWGQFFTHRNSSAMSILGNYFFQ